MAARITIEEVLRVAALARLELGAEEAERMRDQLDKILDYVASLDELDVRDVEPTFHAVPIDAPLRADEATGSLSRSDALGAAPSTEAGAFAVPQVLEGDG